MIGKHIEIFLVDGTPGGLSDGRDHRVDRPRRAAASGFSSATSSSATSRIATACYILLGDDDTAPTGTRAYIGRSENIAQRLRNHAATKEFWDRFVTITTKDDTFTEGHWGYMEARLVAIAKEADRATLTNDNSPQGRKLSEAQSSDMEAFILQLQIILPALNVNVSALAPLPDRVAGGVTKSPVFALVEKRRESRSRLRAQLVDGEFTVLAGSTIVGAWTALGKAESTRRSYANYSSNPRAAHRRRSESSSKPVEGRVARDIRFGVAVNGGCRGAGTVLQRAT